MISSSHSNRSSFEWGIFWMVLSSICLSLSFLFLKINLDFINYYFLLFLRFSVPLAITIILITMTRAWNTLFSGKSIWLQISRCGCVLVSQYAIAYYISKNTLLNATVLLNASPLFIPLLEWAFLKQKPGKSTILGALLAFFGMILVLKPDRSLFTATSAIGIVAAFGQAGSQVLYGLKPKSENILTTLFYLFFFSSLFAWGVFIVDNTELQRVQKTLLAPTTLLILFVFLMGLATLLNQYFRGLAYRCSRPSTLATFLYFSVFASALFDWLIFKISPSIQTIIGSCLIILGGIVKIFLRAHILRKRK